MQETREEVFSMERHAADQIALSPYIQSGPFCLFYQEQTTDFGKIGSWNVMNLADGGKERVAVKPSACFSGTLWAASQGKFFYYQDRYPERAFYQYDPVQKKSERICEIQQTLGSFQADGDWLVFMTDPEPGVLDQPEEFHLLNWQTGEQRVLQSSQVYPGRLPAERHQNWYVKQGKIFWVCHHDRWTDSRGENLCGCLAGYDIEHGEIFQAAPWPENVKVRQMLLQGEALWILGTRGTENLLYCLPMQEERNAGEMKEVLRVEHDSYDQLMDIQLTEQGLFWLRKEICSLLENTSSLWKFSFEQQEPVLMIRLSDFRALDLHFQVVGNSLYYQDELWKYFYCTPLDAPLTKEKIENDAIKG